MRSLRSRARAYINFAPGFIFLVHTLGWGMRPKLVYNRHTRLAHVILISTTIKS